MKIGLKGTIITDDLAWLYDWMKISAVSPGEVARQLEGAAGGDVTLEINSYGGSCTAAAEIRQAVKDYSGKVTAHVICAMSAATVIACAADEVLMSDAGVFMIHNSQSYAEGDYRDMRMAGDMLKQFNEGIINAYEEKTHLSREKIQSLMDRDTFMSAQRAIELGFADGIIGDAIEADAAASVAPMIPRGKARLIEAAIKKMEAENKMQNTGNPGSEINDFEEGVTRMTLAEFLTENPDAKAEVEALVEKRVSQELSEIKEASEGLTASADVLAQVAADAKAEGIKEGIKKGIEEERERIKSLDAIAATVTPEALNNAKYGSEPLDGPTLAYRAMVRGEMTAKAYMADALADFAASGVNEVQAGDIHAGEDENNKSDADATALANHANSARR